VPALPDVIAIHGVLLAALHPQSDGDAVTLTDPEPPLPPTVAPAGAIE
jgi:hypothetical protein